jgi:adenylate kinase family enzyme
MRIAILGNSGSGKSTLAGQLAAVHGLASLDLDAVAWEPGRVAVPRAPGDAARDVGSFCEREARWVVEGCYASLVEAALRHEPILLFLDPGVDACLANCRERPWEPHKYASKAEQDERLAFLLSWVEEYYRREGEMSLVAHRALFEGYAGPKLRMTGRPTPGWVAKLDGMVPREEGLP